MSNREYRKLMNTREIIEELNSIYGILSKISAGNVTFIINFARDFPFSSVRIFKVFNRKPRAMIESERKISDRLSSYHTRTTCSLVITYIP